MTKKFQLDRRTFLRGSLAGTLCTFALPPLEAMFNSNGTAFANGGAIPQRLGVWFWGNGVRPNRWIPKRFGTGDQWSLSEELVPLRAFKSKINVLSNYGIPNHKRAGTAHHRGRGPILTGTYNPNMDNHGKPTGPSLGYITSQAWKDQTPHRSLDVGISLKGQGRGKPSDGIVINEKGELLNVERSPRSVYEKYFKGFASDLTDAQKAALRQRQVLSVDVLREDAAELRGRLGQEDRSRLDEYMSGLADLEKNLDVYESSVCELNFVEPGTKRAYLDKGDYDRELLAEKNAIMSDMIALALACDLTRTFSVTFTPMQSDAVFWQIGAREGSHVMTHDDRGLPVKLAPQLENVHKATVFIMERFADLLERLDTYQLGESTLLDQCCIMATSEVSDGSSHNYDSMPVVLAGGAGKKLKTGLHIDGKNALCHDILLTCLRAVGIETPSIGDQFGRSSKHISALMA